MQIDGVPIAVWNGAGAAQHVAVGTPVAYHPRYHVLSVGAERFNTLAVCKMCADSCQACMDACMAMREALAAG
jgi:hypothetical protein